MLDHMRSLRLQKFLQDNVCFYLVWNRFLLLDLFTFIVLNLVSYQ